MIAALALHGKELKDLPALLEGSGLPKHHVARMGRAGDELLPSEAAVLVLSQRLEVPRSWFEVENWHALIPDPTRVSGPAREAAEAATAFEQAAGPGETRPDQEALPSDDQATRRQHGEG